MLTILPSSAIKAIAKGYLGVAHPKAVRGFLIKDKQHARVGWHGSAIHESNLPRLLRTGYLSLYPIDARLELNNGKAGIDILRNTKIRCQCEQASKKGVANESQHDCILNKEVGQQKIRTKKNPEITLGF
jgi:hypothetical protein